MASMLVHVSTRQFVDESALYDALTSALAPACATPGAIAVFDADGTLWRADATETLLDYLEYSGLIRPPAGWPSVGAYLQMLYEKSYADACIYCATVFESALLQDVEVWSEASFRAQVLPSFVSVTTRLVAWLHGRGVDVHVVSASPWWAIVPGTRALDIPDGCVHALNVDIKNGRLSNRMKGRLQSGIGKAQTVSELRSNPVFVAGNTVDDAAMMQLGSITSLAVEPMSLPDDARCLEDIAQQAGWFILRTQAEV